MLFYFVSCPHPYHHYSVYSLHLDINMKPMVVIHPQTPVQSLLPVMSSRTNNLYALKQLEYQYDEILDKKEQILLLLNVMEEVLEMRDAIISNIHRLERKRAFQREKMHY